MKTIEAVNLWGEPVVLHVSTAKRPEIPNGYAAIPGTGPAGETCKSCLHAFATGSHSKTYWKCALRKASWTHGYGTDIRLKSPACVKWHAKAAA